MKRLLPTIALLLPLLVTAQARDPNHFNNVEEEAPWQESIFKLPPFPKDADLIEFDVGPALSGHYYIDRTSISAGGGDNVVRYVVVVKTAGGATNISYEGLRCDDPSLRLYATGLANGTWSATRNSEWRPLRAFSQHKHQGALYANYFCPNRIAIWSAKEGVDALLRGGHRDLIR